MKNPWKHPGPSSTEQSRSEFNWPPTEDELADSGPDSARTAHERLRAYFNWPPEGESPATSRGQEVAATTADFDWPAAEVAPDTLDAFHQEMTPAPPTSFEPWPPAVDAEPPPEESFATASAAELSFEAARVEPAEEPVIVERAAAADGVVTQVDRAATEVASAAAELAAASDEDGEDIVISERWDVEIARLQALIEGLTETLDSRMTAHRTSNNS